MFINAYQFCMDVRRFVSWCWHSLSVIGFYSSLMLIVLAGIFIELFWFSWNCIDFHRFPFIANDSYRFYWCQWIPTSLCRSLWIGQDTVWFSLNFYGLSIVFYGWLTNFIYCSNNCIVFGACFGHVLGITQVRFPAGWASRLVQHVRLQICSTS